MEHEAEFNLEEAVQQYLISITHQSLLSKNEADELADHLYLETRALSDSGLNDREAFEVAKLRFGEPKKIHEEFLKINPKRLFLQYILIGISFYSMVRISILTSQIIVFKAFNGTFSDINSTVGLSIKSAISITILSLFALFIYRKIKKRNTSFRSIALALTLIQGTIEALLLHNNFMMILMFVLLLAVVIIFKERTPEYASRSHASF